ncbi:transporter substrate-binding domain-containing protein [Streptococcus jiangjianxini]|uniref:transporter substrate-binding domain-containing protein n=1 Tax=Streptococcus jiangjianxini TaxID=3161189 RepID=UPI0032ED0F0F
MKRKFLVALSAIAVLVVGMLTLTHQVKGKTKSNEIIVATDSDTAPFTYKKGKTFTGYDIDVLKAVFKDSSKYHVTFVTTAFDSILTGLDAGRFDIAANDFAYNDDRAEKYLFSKPISKSNHVIVGKSGKKYSSLDDLSGKTTEVLPGVNYADVLKNWNKNHPDKEPIDIRYASSSTGLSTRMQHIESGKIDFILYDAISANYIVKDQGFDLEISDIKDNSGDETDGLEYFLFAKDKKGKELQAYVDKRLEQLAKEGTLKKLSRKHFGGDFSTQLKN